MRETSQLNGTVSTKLYVVHHSQWQLLLPSITDYHFQSLYAKRWNAKRNYTTIQSHGCDVKFDANFTLRSESSSFCGREQVPLISYCLPASDDTRNCQPRAASTCASGRKSPPTAPAALRGYTDADDVDVGFAVAASAQYCQIS